MQGLCHCRCVLPALPWIYREHLFVINRPALTDTVAVMSPGVGADLVPASALVDVAVFADEEVVADVQPS